MSRKDPNYAREAAKYDAPIPSREFILETVSSKGPKLNLIQLFTHLALHKEQDRKALKKRLRAMVRDGQLQQDKRGRYCVPTSTQTFSGVVIGHKDGYGFLSTEDNPEDCYINPQEMRAVFPGDKVMARVISTDRKGRHEVSIIDVLERGTTELVGRIVIEQGKALLSTYNKAIAQDILLGDASDCPYTVGDVVVVAVTQQPTRFQSAKAKVIEKLGDENTPGLEIDIAIRTHDIPVEWPEAVVQQCDEVPETVSDKEIADRKDLRDLPFVTIDGEDAKDFDDAVYCKPTSKGGFQLFVAIADVSHYVKPKSPLDDEAFLRGNSTYFPGRVVPMLPEKLSNGLCSLNPDVDRLVMVCEMHIDSSGKVTRYQFHEGVIHSHARMTYTKVHEILQGNETLCAEYQSLVPLFEDLHHVFHLLLKRREKRGAIEFETVETKILFNEQGKIRQIVPTERNVAHKIIEECMLCANVCAAKFVLKHDKGQLYRVHEGPTLEKLTDLQQTLSELGLHLPGGEDVRPQDYAALIQKITDRPDAKMINTVLLRSLSQAIYSIEQAGHFGLAYEIYTHFTSPIRRYPDLIVHRLIRHILRQHSKRLYSEERLKAIGDQASMTERRSDAASREAIERLKCDFMLDKVGDTFSGNITGVTQFGLFVTLDEFYIEGLVHVSTLGNDYFVYDPINQSLLAEKSGFRYRLGDTLKIQVARVNVDSRQIDFMVKPKKSAPKKTAAKKSGSGYRGRARNRKKK